MDTSLDLIAFWQSCLTAILFWCVQLRRKNCRSILDACRELDGQGGGQLCRFLRNGLEGLWFFAMWIVCRGLDAPKPVKLFALCRCIASCSVGKPSFWDGMWEFCNNVMSVFLCTAECWFWMCARFAHTKFIAKHLLRQHSRHQLLFLITFIRVKNTSSLNTVKAQKTSCHTDFSVPVIKCGHTTLSLYLFHVLHTYTTVSRPHTTLSLGRHHAGSKCTMKYNSET